MLHALEIGNSFLDFFKVHAWQKGIGHTETGEATARPLGPGRP